MFDQKKTVSLVTLVQFLACSGCSPVTWFRADEPHAISQTRNAASAESAAPAHGGAAADPPLIREERPAPMPLAAGPAPSASALDSAAGRLRPAGPAPATSMTSRASDAPGAGGDRGGSRGGYRIGEDDEIEVSVYGDDDLKKTQLVRPDGKIAFPLVGDVQAAGLTPDELRARIARGVARFVRDPRVTVLVTKYNSNRVSVLGEVRTPGLLRLSSDITVLEAISRAGGLTDNSDLRGTVVIRDGQMLAVDLGLLLRGDLSQNVVLQTNDVLLVPDIKQKKVFVLGQVNKPAVLPLKGDVTLVEAISRAEGVTSSADLQGALLVREGRILPVNFDRLLRQGDVSQNVLLKVSDVVLVPDIKDRKVFVLGEVVKPAVVPLRPGVTLVEAIASAGGFTGNAQPKSVVIVRGGLGDPRLLAVNVHKATLGDGTNNIVLEPGDIVYVPRSLVADVVKFFQTITSILTPVVLAMTGIVLGPAVQAVFTGGTSTTSTSSSAVNVSPSQQ